MRDIASIRNDSSNTILAVGSYKPAYQTILDFDFLSGKQTPSIQAIISSSGRYEKYFWGNSKVLIPKYPTINAAKEAGVEASWLFNVSSARRALSVTQEFFASYPDAHGAHIFAEDVPEIHALELYEKFQQNDKTIVGPAGVGLLVPGTLKLGVVGGVDWRMIRERKLYAPGSIAVLSASGGMINEVINLVSKGRGLSFALCFGGDRFPATTPVDAFLAAEKDPATTAIVYYGELGGTDEHDVAQLLEKKLVTKPVICYIAGVIGESFEQPVQFGHAKALAQSQDETASSKRKLLENAGATVAKSMEEFAALIDALPPETNPQADAPQLNPGRKATMFSSTIGKEDPNGGYIYLDTPLPDWAATNDIGGLITASLLGRKPRSTHTSDFVTQIFLLSVDHGPQVSGAVNTIVTARAGKGLVDSIASGLLTIGPRFGGAVSDAARTWFDAVASGVNAQVLVEQTAQQKRYIPGIGHKKYRIGLADPRTAVLTEATNHLTDHPHYNFAKQVEQITTAKKGNLILNVDGHIAALMLDILIEHERLSLRDIDQLIRVDFFNALFVLPRMVGFTAHYLDQKRLDEGLFRLPDDAILLD